MNDLFNWGNDRFVLGQLPSSGGNSTIKRKKSPQEIFMEAILDDEEPTKPAEEEQPLPETETTTESDSEETQASTIDSEYESEVLHKEIPTLDIDTLGLDEEMEQA